MIMPSVRLSKINIAPRFKNPVDDFRESYSIINRGCRKYCKGEIMLP